MKMSDFNKKIHVIGGGTFSHVRSHLAIAAPAFGTTARKLKELYEDESTDMEVVLHLTKMADPNSDIVTNEDVSDLVDKIIADYSTKIVVFNPAMVDFRGSIGDEESGKYSARLSSKKEYSLQLTPSQKIISEIRRTRKDIFLIGFKTTSGASVQEQFSKGLELMKTSHVNLVLANDLVTRNNIIITPEEVWYHETTNRDEALKNLVDMSLLRSHLSFTRSIVISAKPVPWDSELVPESLRKVVNFCIEENAYKQGPTGATVGHFACKIGPTTFLTSRRKVDFNKMSEVGLVKVETSGPDSVIAYGFKPSVGGQSQRIVFDEHKGYDCIVHAHVPLKEGAGTGLDGYKAIGQASQREYECGSHECGQNTSNNLVEVMPGVKAVYLKKHGPNIVFSRTEDPQKIIEYISKTFDLSKKTT